MELITLFRFIEVLVDAPGGAVLTFSTDVPGDVMATRGTATIAATAGRHPYRMSLRGSVKGKLYQVKIVPVGFSSVRIYAAKVYARVLGPQASQWAWYSVPVLDTPVEWQPIKLPIQPTSDEWSPLKLPIPQTSEDWNAVKLPIPPTPEDFMQMQLPVKPTPPVPEWVVVPVDQ